jgi:hypothetical protein
MLSYTVVVPAHLYPAYSQLPKDTRMGVGIHLLTIAEAAAAVHGMGEGQTRWSDLAGLDAGDHRALFGELWLSYSITPEAQELELLDFGDSSFVSRVAAPRPATADRRGKGAAQRAVARSRDLHVPKGVRRI